MEKDNQRLQKAASKVNQKINAGDEAISLDQPFPEDLTSQRVPFRPVTAIQSPQKEEKTEPEGEIADPEVIPTTGEPVVGNFKLTDLIKIPIRPPQAVKTEGYKATANSNVLFFTIVGAILALAGVIILFAVNTLLGLIVIVLGVAAVLISVFAPMS